MRTLNIALSLTFDARSARLRYRSVWALTAPCAPRKTCRGS